MQTMTNCPAPEEIYDAIRKKYAEVSVSVEGIFKYPTGREGAEFLGYDLSVVNGLPDTMTGSFCGVGNPFSLGDIKYGETVLDIGSGGGFDLLMAGNLVGPEGHVFGIDLTPEMVEKARLNVTDAGLRNAEVKLVGSDSIPFDDGYFDVIISNGVLNLSPRKEKTFQEIFRVLKPGGRFQFADIVLKEGSPQKETCSINDWTG